MKKLLAILPLILFLVFAIFFWRGLSLDPHHLPSAQIGKTLPLFELPALDEGKFSSKQLEGKVSLLNVWGSWCQACVEEQAFLMQLAQEGVPIYGLNYKDFPEDARKWLQDFGNPYRAIGSDQNGKIAIDLGVYGAPETFLLDKNGRILFRYPGPLNMIVWEKEFLPLIKQLNREA